MRRKSNALNLQCHIFFNQCVKLFLVTFVPGIIAHEITIFIITHTLRLYSRNNVVFAIFEIDYKAFYATALTSATFRNPNGWKQSNGTVLSTDEMSNPTTAATYLITSNLIRS